MGARRQIYWEKKKTRHKHHGNHKDLRLDDAPEAGSRELDLSPPLSRLAIVVKRDRGIPYADTRVAEEFGCRHEAGFTHHGKADKLTCDALHPGGDIGNDGRIEESVGNQENPGKTGNEI